MSARWTKLQRRRRPSDRSGADGGPRLTSGARSAVKGRDADAADDDDDTDDDEASSDGADCEAAAAAAEAGSACSGAARRLPPASASAASSSPLPPPLAAAASAAVTPTPVRAASAGGAAAQRRARQELQAAGAGKSAAPAAAASGSAEAAPSKPAAQAEGQPAEEQQEKPKRYVTLLPSVFEGRPPVLLFSYTVACGAVQRNLERAVSTGEEVPRLFYSHTDQVHEYNAVINILRQGGLYRVRADCNRWTLLWSKHPNAETLRLLRPIQRTNHFPGSWHLGHKDLIWRNVARMQKRFGKAFNIAPQSYVLPKNSHSWEAARLRQPSTLWIWKPCSQSCGRGIRVLSSNLSQEDELTLARKRGVVSRYIEKPLLLDGYKCDLRVYVVVLSYDPLKVYINDEGLVRQATEKYSSSPDTLSFTNMHLTNYSVNKSSPVFVQPLDGRESLNTKSDKDQASGAAAKMAPAGEEGDEDTPRAFKWSFAELRRHFEKRGLDYDAMFDGIKDLVIKTLIAVEGPLRTEWSAALGQSEEGWAAQGASGCHRGSCFEQYGFDVIVDSAMKPWLLEVNICPSLSSGSPLDKRIKTKLVADSLTLAGLRPPASVASPQRPGAGVKRKADGVTAEACAETTDVTPIACTMSKVALDERAARLRGCKTPEEAVKLFEQAEWELVMDAHDEDMRCGGLERIFPTASSVRYVPFWGEESYCNLVLRRWHEAGGNALFDAGAAGGSLLPSWLPRKICFTRT